jgi:chromosome segregation ATPase
MTLEETLNSLKEAFTGKSAEAETHAAALAAKQTELTEALAIVESLKGNETALNAKVASLEADLAKAKELAAAAVAAKAEAEAKIESAGKKAASIAASVGVEPVEVSPAVVESAKSAEDMTAEWVALKQTDPKAAREFYDKNRAAILKAAGL